MLVKGFLTINSVVGVDYDHKLFQEFRLKSGHIDIDMRVRALNEEGEKALIDLSMLVANCSQISISIEEGEDND